MNPREARMLADLFAARWLGHGRAVECLLACAACLYGLLLLSVPGAAFDSMATADLASYGRALALPLLTKAALTGGGLIMNIKGSRFARHARIAGAFLGSMIWIWLTFKFALLHAFATPSFAFSVFSAIFSVRIMGMAAANLPRPGAPGLL